MGGSCLKEIYQSFVINIHLFVMVIMVDLLAKKENMILAAKRRRLNCVCREMRSSVKYNVTSIV